MNQTSSIILVIIIAYLFCSLFSTYSNKKLEEARLEAEERRRALYIKSTGEMLKYMKYNEKKLLELLINRNKRS